MNLFLEVSRLSRGDIVLIRSRDITSRIIAASLKGAFSHGQVVIEQGTVAEATTKEGSFSGLRKFMYPYVRIRRRSGQVLLVSDLSEYSHFKVLRYRPPRLAERRKARAKLNKVLPGVIGPLWGRPYNLPGALGVAFRWVPHILDGLSPRHQMEGFFCFELILEAYSRCGLPLYNLDRPVLATPNDLFGGRVKHLIDVTSDVTVALSKKERLRFQKSWQRRLIDRIGGMVQNSLDTAAQISAQQREEWRDVFARDIPLLTEMLQRLSHTLTSRKAGQFSGLRINRKSFREFRSWFTKRLKEEPGVLRMDREYAAIFSAIDSASWPPKKEFSVIALILTDLESHLKYLLEEFPSLKIEAPISELKHRISLLKRRIKPIESSLQGSSKMIEVPGVV